MELNLAQLSKVNGGVCISTPAGVLIDALTGVCIGIKVQ